MSRDRWWAAALAALLAVGCGGDEAPEAEPAPEVRRPAAETAAGDSALNAPAGDSAAAAAPAPAPAAAPAQAEAAPESGVVRETYAYGGGARDPFASLLINRSSGPELADLQLVAIYRDVRYAGNSVVVLRDRRSDRRYKLRTGEQLGRMRVAQISDKDVVFTVEDFGFERQETLSLRKQEETE